MDLFFLIIVWGIVLYLIFGNQTKKKYKKGLSAFISNDFDLAEILFQQIVNKHPEAKRRLDEITLKRGENEEAKGNLDEAVRFYSILKVSYPEIEKRLILLDYKRGQEEQNHGNLDLAYDYFSKIADKDKNAFLEASKIDFRRGVASEISNNYALAKSFYQRSSNFIDNPKIHFGSICRKLICDLKSGIIPSEEEASIITNSYFDDAFKNDLIYRYALALLSDEGRYKQALSFINEHIKDTIPEFDVLREYHKNFQKSQFRKIATEVNGYLKQQGTETDALVELYEKISINEPLINALPEYQITINEFQRHLFNKLQYQYLIENRFTECLDHIIDYPGFFNHIELLKNAGICCIRIALENRINGMNFKKIIPIWLTVIYNDDIFINSIESTEWDDDYSFTIRTSVGKYGSFTYTRKWENINQDNPSESNISIGDVQRELIYLFEKALENIQPEELQKKIYTFYSEEKEAVTELIELLGYDTLHATPEFAKKYNLNSTIINHANKRYETRANEKLLNVGSKYVNLKVNEKGGVQLLTDSNFERYASSLFYQQSALSRLSSKAPYQLLDTVYKDVIHRFPSIEMDFEEKSIIILRNFMQNDDLDESLIPLIEKLIHIIPASERIRFLFADYITNLCINKINANTLTEIKGLEFLFKAVIFCSNSHKAAKNLAVLIKLNLSEEKFSEKLKTLMPTLQNVASENVLSAFSNELVPYRDTLKDLLKKPNINYAKVKDGITIINNLINAVQPTVK